jgi:hypothetical protein
MLPLAILSLWSAFAKRGSDSEQRRLTEMTLAMASLSPIRGRLRDLKGLQSLLHAATSTGLDLDKEVVERAAHYAKVGELLIGEHTREVGIRLATALGMREAYVDGIRLSSGEVEPNYSLVDAEALLGEFRFSNESPDRSVMYDWSLAFGPLFLVSRTSGRRPTRVPLRTMRLGPGDHTWMFTREGLLQEFGDLLVGGPSETEDFEDWLRRATPGSIGRIELDQGDNFWVVVVDPLSYTSAGDYAFYLAPTEPAVMVPLS